MAPHGPLPFLQRWQSSRSFTALSALVWTLLACSLLAAPVPIDTKPDSYPAWWFEREVIKQSTQPPVAEPVWPDNYPLADDYTAANLGQLKQVATAAFDELNAHLPVSGAGPELDTFIKSWFQLDTTGDFVRVDGRRQPLVTAHTDDFAALNLGQLKAVAKVFYDRLIAVHYTDAYPWDRAESPPDDWAVANLGQVKSLFAIDLVTSTLHNELPDWWVRGWHLGEVNDPAVPAADPDGDGFDNLYEFQHDTDPTSFYNGQGVVLTLLSGDDQTVLPGTFLANPIVVSVTKANGDPWPGAPVLFSAASGLGAFALGNDGSEDPQSTLKVQTGNDGTAQVYFQPAASVTGSVYASAGGRQIPFKVSGYDPDSAPPTAPVLTSTPVSSTQTNFAWSSDATNSTGTQIQRWTYATGWTTIYTVPAGTNTYSDTSVPTGGGVVAYRVVSTNSAGSSPVSQIQSSDGSDLKTKDSDDDGLTDEEEIAMGSNPNTPDTDGDGVIDGKDLFPLDPELKLPRVAKPSYAVVDLTDLNFVRPTALNDSLQILDASGPIPGQARLWSKGEFKPIPDPEPIGDNHSSWGPRLSNSGGVVCGVVSSHPPGATIGYWSPTSGLKNLTFHYEGLGNFPVGSVEYPGASTITETGIVLGSSWGGGTKLVDGIYFEETLTYSCGVQWAPGANTGIPVGDVFTSTTDSSQNTTYSGTDYFDPLAGNRAGIFVGWGRHTNSEPYTHAAAWDGGPVTLSDAGGSPRSINNSDQLVAVGENGLMCAMWVKTDAGWKEKPIGSWKVSEDKVENLGGHISKVNDRCEMLGSFRDQHGKDLGQFWQNGQVVNLEDRVSHKYSDFYPIDINNKGAIIAWASKADGGDAAVLLLPAEVKVYQPYDTPLAPENPSVIRPYEGSRKFYKGFPKDEPIASNLFALWPTELAAIKITGLDSLIDSLPQDYIQWESDSATTFEVKDKKREVKFAWNTASVPWGNHWIKLKLGDSEYKIHFDVPDIGPYVQEDLPRLIGAQDAFTIFVRKDEIKDKVAAYVNQDAGCKNDAIKHGTWSAWLAQEFGEVTAKLVTNAHEGSNKMEKDFAFNSTMDQHNNAYGRFVFSGFQAVHPTEHLSVDQWIPKIAEHYPTGDLWIWWPKTKESNKSEGILRCSDDKKIK